MLMTVWPPAASPTNSRSWLRGPRKPSNRVWACATAFLASKFIVPVTWSSSSLSASGPCSLVHARASSIALRPFFQWAFLAGLPCRPQLRTSLISSPLRLVSSSVISGAELPGDHHLLPLVGPLSDRQDLGVAVEPAHGVLLDVPVPAVDLNRFFGRPHGQAAGLELGLRRRQREVLARVLLERRLVGQEARGLDLARHVGQLGLDGLELGDRLAEGVPFARVRQ